MARKKAADHLSTACELIARDGWRNFRLSALADHADVDVAEIYAEFDHRTAVIRALGERADRHVLEVDREELAGLTPRERLFELVMRRLDALAPYKPAIRSVAREAGVDPALMCALAHNADRAAEIILDLTGGEWRGLRAIAAKSAVQALFARIGSTWLADDTEDLAKTMAELDKRTKQLSRLVEIASKRAPCCGRARTADASGEAEAA